MRNVTLTRTLRLAKLLEQTRYHPGLKHYAEYFEVHERTIRRDFEALEAAGWKVPAKPWSTPRFPEESDQGLIHPGMRRRFPA